MAVDALSTQVNTSPVIKCTCVPNAITIGQAAPQSTTSRHDIPPWVLASTFGHTARNENQKLAANVGVDVGVGVFVAVGVRVTVAVAVGDGVTVGVVCKTATGTGGGVATDSDTAPVP